MRPRKGRFEVVPYVGNKQFSSFGKKIEKKILFLEKIYFNNLMTWQFPCHVNSLYGMGIFHWNEVPNLGSSKITRNPSLASFFF